MSSMNDGVKNFYNTFSKSYTDYANGSSSIDELLNLDASHMNRAFSWGDVQTWQAIVDSINLLIADKALDGKPYTIKILDIGCGDGTWSLRAAHYCASKSVAVNIDCLDISPEMIENAKRQFDFFREHMKYQVNLNVAFELCDLTEGLPESTKLEKYDIILCLHTVLNHIPSKDLSFSIGELIRASQGFVYFSVKPPFSRPTFYAAPMSDILHFDRRNENLYALDRTGTFHTLRSSLISHEQLISILNEHPVTADYIGLDVLISRMTPDPRWVGDDETIMSLPIDDLISLEGRMSLDQRYLNFANHILVAVDTRHRT
jgi:SAM-dependent methyltransferase